MNPGTQTAYWAWIESTLLHFVYFGLLAWLASTLDRDDPRRRSGPSPTDGERMHADDMKGRS